MKNKLIIEIYLANLYDGLIVENLQTLRAMEQANLIKLDENTGKWLNYNNKHFRDWHVLTINGITNETADKFTFEFAGYVFHVVQRFDYNYYIVKGAVK